jgi:hypothetical protein
MRVLIRAVSLRSSSETPTLINEVAQADRIPPIVESFDVILKGELNTRVIRARRIYQSQYKFGLWIGQLQFGFFLSVVHSSRQLLYTSLLTWRYINVIQFSYRPHRVETGPALVKGSRPTLIVLPQASEGKRAWLYGAVGCRNLGRSIHTERASSTYGPTFVNRLHDFLGPPHRVCDCADRRRDSFPAVEL